MGESRADRCWTCGRPRGLEQKRESYHLDPTVWIPRTDNPCDSPVQQSNDLICSVSVYRNGGTGEDTHLCNECLRIALRALKTKISQKLGELDEGHEKDAEMVELTHRLAKAQMRRHDVAFDHNRMQERLRDLLAHVPDSADHEVVRMARWEASRERANDD